MSVLTSLPVLQLQAQFLDRHHLLIALGHPDTVMARNMDVAPGLVFFVVYHIATSTVRKVTSNNTDGMVTAYIRHASMFHAADIRNEWERYMTPTVVGLQPPDQQERVITRQWGYPMVCCPCCSITHFCLTQFLFFSSALADSSACWDSCYTHSHTA